MHYDVERAVLHELAREIETLAVIERKTCTPEKGGCKPAEHEKCHVKGECSEETKEFCHGKQHCEEGGHHGDRKCHRS